MPDFTAFPDHVLEDIPVHVVRGFREFHFRNPHIFSEFAERAFQIRTTRRAKYSVRTIFEVMRWDHDIRTTGDDEFKVNNNFTSCYARVLLHFYPEFTGFFDLRTSNRRESET